MEQTYLKLVQEAITCGDYRVDRTKVGTYSLFGSEETNHRSKVKLTTQKIEMSLKN